MTVPFRRPLRLLPSLLLAVLLPALLDSCSSSTKIKGLPKKLPVIHLNGSPDTPPHSMSREEYPFASDGDYMTTWAAEGEKKAGRGPGSDSDYTSWRSSHGGSASKRKQPSPVRKVSSSSSKSKSSSGTKGSYTIKKGDTLSGIARKHGTTVAKLKATNGLKSDLIREGKSLKIPK